ncbi:hypothetical protein [Streptomyces sp. NRRL B-1347]|uniref:hypothetical protein n=1 Tax=Streptomyces sp. NRRL B-1347 TaxID=1476877 RepID=UPI0004CA99AB|nr:hypothetical protein [Streptomyces sp. NRRL B-1347]
MTITTELIDELRHEIKRFRITPERLAELDCNGPDNELTITWQVSTGRPPTVLVTTPADPDSWALPVPHRPPWLLDLITQHAPSWWLK